MAEDTQWRTPATGATLHSTTPTTPPAAGRVDGDGSDGHAVQATRDAPTVPPTLPTTCKPDAVAAADAALATRPGDAVAPDVEATCARLRQEQAALLHYARALEVREAEVKQRCGLALLAVTLRRRMAADAANPLSAAFRRWRDLTSTPQAEVRRARQIHRDLLAQVQQLSDAGASREAQLGKQALRAETRAREAELALHSLTRRTADLLALPSSSSRARTTAELEATVESLSTSLQHARREAAVLKRRVASLESSDHTLKACMADNGASATQSASRSVRALTDTIRLLQARLADVESGAGTAPDPVELSVAAELERATQQCAMWKTRYDSVTAQVSTATAAAAVAQAEVHRLAAEVDGKAELCNQLQSEAAALNEKAAKHEAVTQQLVAVLKASSGNDPPPLDAEEVSMLRTRLQAAEDRATAAEATVRALRGEATALRSQVQLLQSQHDATPTDGTPSAAADSQPPPTATPPDSVAAAPQDQVALLEGQVTELTAVLGGAQARVADLTAANQRLVRQLQRAQSQAEAADAATRSPAADAVASSSSLARDALRTVEALKDTVRSQRQRMEQSAGELRDYAQDGVKQKEELLFLQAMVQKQQAVIADIAPLLSKLQTAHSSAEESHSRTIRSVKPLAAAVIKAAPTPELVALASSVAGTLAGRGDALDDGEDVGVVSGELGDLARAQARVAELEVEVADAEAEVGHRGEEVDTLLHRVTELEQALEMSQAEVWRLTEELMAKFDAADHLRARQRGLEAALVEAEATVVTLKAKMAAAGLPVPHDDDDADRLSSPASAVDADVDTGEMAASVPRDAGRNDSLEQPPDVDAADEEEPPTPSHRLDAAASINDAVAAIVGFDASILPPEAQESFQTLLQLAEHGHLLSGTRRPPVAADPDGRDGHDDTYCHSGRHGGDDHHMQRAGVAAAGGLSPLAEVDEPPDSGDENNGTHADGDGGGAAAGDSGTVSPRFVEG